MSAKVLTGRIVSAKIPTRVVVAVEMHKKHAIYSKIVKNTRRFMAINDLGAKEKDLVVIEECRPVSKKVSWKIIKKVEEK